MKCCNTLTRVGRLALCVVSIGVASAASATALSYTGETFFCTATCDSFGALGGESGGSSNPVNSSVVGSIEFPDLPPGPFTISIAQAIPFSFAISNTAIALEQPVFGPTPTCPPPNETGQICNAGAVNPLPLDNSVSTLEGSGVIDASGRFVSGTLQFVFTAAPLSNNGAVVTFDLADSTATGTIFGGVIEFTRIAGSFSPVADDDDDGIGDGFDNCIMVSNTDQRDSNADGFGNACDADLNNDCFINAADLGLFRSLFFSDNADGDFNGDGVVSTIDLGILRQTFFSPPGPSGRPNACQ